MGAVKEAVIAGPGSGKTVYLAGKSIEPGALTLDPVGALRSMTSKKALAIIYDVHNPKTFQQLTRKIKECSQDKTPCVVDLSELRPMDAVAASDEIGTWLRNNYRGGSLVVDEIRWLMPVAAGINHGLAEFIAKSRNYDVPVYFSAHRPSMIHKDVLGLVDQIRIGKQVQTLDLEASAKLLKATVGGGAKALDEIAAKLPHLGPGQWYVFQAAAPG